MVKLPSEGVHDGGDPGEVPGHPGEPGDPGDLVPGHPGEHPRQVPGNMLTFLNCFIFIFPNLTITPIKKGC